MKVRNIVDRAQAKLAEAAGLEDKAPFGWRNCLSSQETSKARIQTARNLLQNQKSPSVLVLLESNAAMKLIVKGYKRTRHDDTGAHGQITNQSRGKDKENTRATSRSEEAGLVALLTFVCAVD